MIQRTRGRFYRPEIGRQENRPPVLKYTYNETAQAFTNSAGNRLPKSLQGNQEIIDAFNKAKKLIEQGW